MTTTPGSPAAPPRAADSPDGAPADPRLVYRFGAGAAEGSGAMGELLGGKGAGLAEMSEIGIPVPPGFTITTEVCSAYYALGQSYPPGLQEQVASGIEHVESLSGARFGDPSSPLLLSVRSGARVSMPGMMDTVLNLGLNDETAAGLQRASGDERFAYDSYRRFVQMYANVVLGVRRASEESADPFEALLAEAKRRRGVELDTDLPADELRELVERYKEVVLKQGGRPFPDDPEEQLWGAIAAVFDSWNSPRAAVYRQLHGYPSEWGTAVTVQAMVFGNLGDDCATGVCFTRDPATGARGLVGEFLVNAQGEDVVAGVRTPRRLASAAPGAPGEGATLEEAMPRAFSELAGASTRLEEHFRDVQDIEFTIQQDRLWILQTRSAKRSGYAMVASAVDMVSDGLIDEDEAIARQDPEQLGELLHKVFRPGAPREVIARGLAASPGAAVGAAVFTPAAAVEAQARGEAAILVRDETSPEDIEGMSSAVGILTARGGTTSHAAVVARGMGTPCVSGCAALQIDHGRDLFTVPDGDGGLLEVPAGEVISIDGSTGEVMRGAVALADASFPPEYERLMTWVNRRRRLGVRANADTPDDAERARAFGAEGIGLCRTEHMFFGEDRILAVREMILAEDEGARRAALARILPMQRGDFAGILRAMDGYPVTIRLLDPPLHEFLPRAGREQEELAEALGRPLEAIARRVDALREFNPMLGHRGVRLAITYPEIYETQVRAILEAACELDAEGVEVHPEIMIPLVSTEAELAVLRERVVAVAERTMEAAGRRVDVAIGTMIELPRACLVADLIAEHADFFSFGTNDLTQTAFGLSRDDAGRFLPAYLEAGVLSRDPFVELDTVGVGGLVKLGIERGRRARPDLKVGICGEHGGNPPSVAFCHEAGLDYVSCSPYRVPIALLAAAQAAVGARPA